MNATIPTLLYIDDDAALARLVDRGLTRLGFKEGRIANNLPVLLTTVKSTEFPTPRNRPAMTS